MTSDKFCQEYRNILQTFAASLWMLLAPGSIFLYVYVYVHINALIYVSILFFLYDSSGKVFLKCI